MDGEAQGELNGKPVQLCVDQLKGITKPLLKPETTVVPLLNTHVVACLILQSQSGLCSVC